VRVSAGAARSVLVAARQSRTLGELCMAHRTDDLPGGLADAVRTCHRLENLATTPDQRRRARAATNRLLASARCAGWSRAALARAMGIAASCVGVRIRKASGCQETLGVSIPRPPGRRDDRAVRAAPPEPARLARAR